MSDRRYTLWFNRIEAISNMVRVKLLDEFESAEAIYHADRSALRRTAILKYSEIEAIEAAREQDIDHMWEDLKEMGISFVSIEDKEYPGLLRNIYDKPYGLYYIGTLPPDGRKMTAIVGARQCSSYGYSTAHEIGYLMAKTGCGIISGMARGIDSAAQKGALTGNGYTCAILGCGVDVCYPPENRELYQEIKKRGCILSEFAPGCPPDSKHFPRRNRLISGISESVIVVEARVRSGSLITAQMALQQNREVYAVPGRINDPMSEGTNRLIEQGAQIIPSTERLLEKMTEDSGLVLHLDKQRQPSLNKKEKTVYAAIDYYAKSAEAIMNEVQISYRDLLEIIYSLTEAGLIKETFRNNYVRI